MLPRLGCLVEGIYSVPSSTGENMGMGTWGKFVCRVGVLSHGVAWVGQPSLSNWMGCRWCYFSSGPECFSANQPRAALRVLDHCWGSTMSLDFLLAPLYVCPGAQRDGLAGTWAFGFERPWKRSKSPRKKHQPEDDRKDKKKKKGRNGKNPPNTASPS